MNANYHEYTAQEALCCVMSTPGVAAICLQFHIHSEAKLAHCSCLSQHALHAISLLLFSKVEWKQWATVSLYCNALYCILFPSVKVKLIFRTADMTLAVSVAVSPHNFLKANSKNQLHNANISLLITILTIKLSHYQMNVYCPVGSGRSSAAFPLEAKTTLYSDLNITLKEAGKRCF